MTLLAAPPKPSDPTEGPDRSWPGMPPPSFAMGQPNPNTESVPVPLPPMKPSVRVAVYAWAACAAASWVVQVPVAVLPLAVSGAAIAYALIQKSRPGLVDAASAVGRGSGTGANPARRHPAGVVRFLPLRDLVARTSG